jgi:multiple sugar transport system substrate-binding protein
MMSPSIASDGHQRALQRWRELAQYMPNELRDGSTGDLWQAFVEGSVAYLVAQADFFPYAIERGIDPGVLGAMPLPGEKRASGEIISAGNVTGASWGGVTMSSASDRPAAEVTAVLRDFAALESQQRLWSDLSTGVTPAPASQADAERISSTLAASGWPEAATSLWTNAIGSTFASPIQLPALRIAETRRYLQALEDRIVPFLVSGDGSAADTLSAAASDWDEINAAIGIETQLDLYTRSLMLPPSE